MIFPVKVPAKKKIIIVYYDCHNILCDTHIILNMNSYMEHPSVCIKQLGILGVLYRLDYCVHNSMPSCFHVGVSYIVEAPDAAFFGERSPPPSPPLNVPL